MISIFGASIQGLSSNKLTWFVFMLLCIAAVVALIVWSFVIVGGSSKWDESAAPPGVGAWTRHAEDRRGVAVRA